MREIETALLAKHKRFYHLGVEAVAKSTLSEAMNHYLLIACLRFLSEFKLEMTELTNRIRNALMQNQSLLEVMSLDRKILEKPPNWNLPIQEELFSPLLL